MAFVAKPPGDRMVITRGNIHQEERFLGKDVSVIEIKTLKKLFEEKPGNSTITFVCKCSGCGNDVLIDITHTSGGFGLDGGFLFEYAPDKYFIKCRNCNRLNKNKSGP
jgi:hypothetical protein